MELSTYKDNLEYEEVRAFLQDLYDTVNDPVTSNVMLGRKIHQALIRIEIALREKRMREKHKEMRTENESRNEFPNIENNLGKR